NVVALRLSRGGLMHMFRSAGGDVQQMQLVGTVPRRSVLRGSVRRGHGGTGRTFLPQIAGAPGVRIRLKTPPFLFHSPSPTAAVERLRRKMPVPAAQPAVIVHRSFSGRRWGR